MVQQTSILETCRTACEAALDSSLQHVRVNHEAIKELASAIDAQAIDRASSRFKFPLKFATIEDELSFMALMRLLEFGSGFDKELHELKDKNSKDVTQMGVIGMHMANDGLTASTFQNFTGEHVMTMFGIDTHVQAESGIPGVSMSKPGPLSSWTQRLTATINDAGKALEALGHNSLGACIVEAMMDCTAGGRAATAAHLISELVDSIPGFADSPSVCDHTIPFCRKAQLLATDLYVRFSSESPVFNFSDVTSIGPDSGAGAIAYIRSHGCVECSSEVSTAIAEGTEMQRGEKEGCLRAACDVATRALASEVGVDAWKFSRWLQAQLQSNKVEGLVPHVTRNTTAY